MKSLGMKNSRSLILDNIHFSSAGERDRIGVARSAAVLIGVGSDSNRFAILDRIPDPVPPMWHRLGPFGVFLLNAKTLSPRSDSSGFRSRFIFRPSISSKQFSSLEIVEIIGQKTMGNGSALPIWHD